MRIWLKIKFVFSKISGCMFGSKMISKLFSSIIYKIKFLYYCIKNLPSLVKLSISEFREYCVNFKYKLSHLKETNFQLGIEHLYKGNLNDAIFRLQLVDKFIAPNHPPANYWLGWAYFLKNNYKKAELHLQKSLEADKVGLQDFLLNYKNYREIPEPIWQLYRDLTANQYSNNLRNENNIHLPYSFIRNVLDKITSLPDSYNILELGSNTALVGYEVQKRFPNGFTFIGIESSIIMNGLVDIYYPSIKIYDQLLTISVKDFIVQNQDKFDVILSLCGLSFTNDLITYFQDIYSKLNDNGYFAFSLPLGDNTELSLKRKEFIFKLEDIVGALKSTNFTVLDFSELELEKDKKYCIVMCKK